MEIQAKIRPVVAGFLKILATFFLLLVYTATVLGYDLEKTLQGVDQGYAYAQYDLGELYDLGLGVPQDYTEAARWYKLAAQQGLVKAQFNLGWMYYSGRGMPQDLIIAYIWWNLASSKGSQEATLSRDYISKLMNKNQIEYAQSLAMKCFDSNYRDCF